MAEHAACRQPAPVCAVSMFALLSRACAAADFFISALNTRFWHLLVGIVVVYMATFFIFAGFWLLLTV